MQAICNTSTKSFKIVIIYRPPNCSTADFFLEFSDQDLEAYYFFLVILISIWINLSHLVYPDFYAF